MPWRRMRSEGIAPTFLTLSLGGGEWSASCPGRSNPGRKSSPVPTRQEARWAPQPGLKLYKRDTSPYCFIFWYSQNRWRQSTLYAGHNWAWIIIMIIYMWVERGELAEETQAFVENLSQCYFVHHKFHTNWPGIKPRPQGWEASG
jgi:hypothetical protein